MKLTPTKIERRNRDRWHCASWREYSAKPRIYFSVKGENLVENFAYRWDRPSKLYRTVLDGVREAAGIPADAKITWSQKAGCSCGCSPGFIVSDLTGQPYDVFVTVEGEQAKVKDEPNTDRLAVRAETILQVKEGKR